MVDAPRSALRFRVPRALAAMVLTTFVAACSTTGQPTTRPSQPAAPTSAVPATATAATATTGPAATIDLLTFRFSPTELAWATAVEKGYFAEQALTVNVIDGNPSATTVGVVAADATKFGLVDGSVVIRSVAQDIPLKAVIGLYQDSPLGIFVRTDSGITDAKGLEGKRLAGTSGGGSEVLFPFWMRSQGADPDTVEIIYVDAAVRNQSFIDGTVDGAFNFATEIGTYAAAGMDVVNLRYADSGFNVPSVSVVVNNSLIEDNPDLVRRFVTAYQKALVDLEADPDSALDALIEHGPDTLNRDILAAQWEVGKNLLRTDRTANSPAGYMAPEDWADGIEIINQLGDLARKPTVEEVMTNEFIPGT